MILKNKKVGDFSVVTRNFDGEKMVIYTMILKNKKNYIGMMPTKRVNKL